MSSSRASMPIVQPRGVTVIRASQYISSTKHSVRLTALYRADKVLVRKFGLKKAFLTGSNATLRNHCKQHWAEYKTRCEANQVDIREKAMPPLVLKMLQADAAAEEDEATGKKRQPTLADLGIVASTRPKAFDVATVLEHVSKYICCTDAVSHILQLLH